MTTQAQIDAAKKRAAELFDAAPWLADESNATGKIPGCLNMTWSDLSALTAEVERPEVEYVEGQAVAISAGPLAAEEDEKEYKPIYNSPANLQRMANAALVSHTIERCAQKCDELARAAEEDSEDEEINARTDAFAEAAAALRAMINERNSQ